MIVLLGYVAMPVFAQTDYTPLVQCGRSAEGDAPVEQQRQCTTCDVFATADNVIDLVTYGIVPPLAVALFIVAGFFIITGGGTVGRIALGKRIFWYTFVGVLIVFSAWLVTNTFLKSFAPGDVSDRWHEITCETEIELIAELPDDWAYGCINESNVYTCDQSSDETRLDSSCTSIAGCEGRRCFSMPTANCGEEAPTDNVPFAQEILNRTGIGLSTNADCDAPFHAKGTIQELAAGQLPSICSRDCQSRKPKHCAPDGQTTVDDRLLRGILGLRQHFDALRESEFCQALEEREDDEHIVCEDIVITITSLTTGIHSENSAHYEGRAVDIVISPGGADQYAPIWIIARDFLSDLAGGTSICENPIDHSSVESCNHSEGGQHHIHWEL